MGLKVLKEQRGDSSSTTGKGRFIQAVAFNLGAASVLVVEATTMHNEVKASIQADFTDIHVEDDNKMPI